MRWKNCLDICYLQTLSLAKFKHLSCRMSFNTHFLDLHLDYFPENHDAASKNRGVRFHQDLREIERKY